MCSRVPILIACLLALMASCSIAPKCFAGNATDKTAPVFRYNSASPIRYGTFHRARRSSVLGLNLDFLEGTDDSASYFCPPSRGHGEDRPGSGSARFNLPSSFRLASPYDSLRSVPHLNTRSILWTPLAASREPHKDAGDLDSLGPLAKQRIDQTGRAVPGDLTYGATVAHDEQEAWPWLDFKLHTPLEGHNYRFDHEQLDSYFAGKTSSANGIDVMCNY